MKPLHIVWLLVFCSIGCASGGATMPGYEKPYLYGTVSTMPGPGQQATRNSSEGRLWYFYNQSNPKDRGKGPKLRGFADKETKRPLTDVRYTELYLIRGDLAIGKDVESGNFERISLPSGRRKVLPGSKVFLVRSGMTQSTGINFPVMADKQDDGRWSVTLLSPELEPTTVVRDVIGRSFVEGRPPVQYLPAGGFAVSFAPDEGDPYDVIFDQAGVPISPPLNGLVRHLGLKSDYGGAVQLAVEVDAERELSWPLRDDGKIVPMPEDCLGIRPLKHDWRNSLVAGYAVGWRTEAGERWAVYPKARVDLQELLATRDATMFESVSMVSGSRQVSNHTVVEAIVMARLPADSDTGGWSAWTLVDGQNLLDAPPLFAGPFASEQLLKNHIRGWSRQSEQQAAAVRQEEHEKAKAAYEKHLALKAAREEAKRAAHAAALAKVRDLIRQGKYEEADRVASEAYHAEAMCELAVARGTRAA